MKRHEFERAWQKAVSAKLLAGVSAQDAGRTVAASMTVPRGTPAEKYLDQIRKASDA